MNIIFDILKKFAPEIITGLFKSKKCAMTFIYLLACYFIYDKAEDKYIKIALIGASALGLAFYLYSQGRVDVSLIEKTGKNPDYENGGNNGDNSVVGIEATSLGKPQSSGVP